MLLIGQVAMGVYGVLLIVGGIVGMVRTGSHISLFAGAICGGISLGALWVSLSDPAMGFLIGGMLAFLLAGIFINRFSATRKLMPAAAVLVLSLAVGILLLIARHEAILPK